VIRTRVGYTGGTKVNPTYHALGDHSEAVEIDYDPSVVTYGELLEIFWKSHDPGSRSWSRQYRSAIFYHNDEQKRLAIDSKKLEQARIGSVYTEVLPAGTFYLAEAYHQKYYLRQRPDLLGEIQMIHPGEKGLIDSTAAARINGHLAGNGSCPLTKSELKDLLPPGRSDRISSALCGRSE
jgi:methionine-S-sulfoxide reductase